MVLFSNGPNKDEHNAFFYDVEGTYVKGKTMAGLNYQSDEYGGLICTNLKI